MIFLDFLSKYKKFGDRVDMFNFVYKKQIFVFHFFFITVK